MMVPSAFDEENCVLDPPPGWTQDECASLSMFRGENDIGEPVSISCWRPTAEEWDEMRRTGRVWLILYGHIVPPHLLLGTHPFHPPEPEKINEPS